MLKYLESSAETEDTVVGLLWRETLEGEKDSLGLFWDQVIGSIKRRKGQKLCFCLQLFHSDNPHHSIDIPKLVVPGRLPQAELSVTSGIGVPVGKRSHPPLQPRTLDNEVCERWLRHDVVM